MADSGIFEVWFDLPYVGTDRSRLRHSHNITKMVTLVEPELYFNQPCGSYDDYLKIKAELEQQGFEFMTNAFTNRSTDGNTIDDVLAMTQRFQSQGHQVIKTRAYTKTDHQPIEYGVAIFVKKN